MNPLLSWALRIGSVILVAGSIYGTGYVKGRAAERDKADVEKAEAAAAAFHITTKHEVQYVDRIERIPGPTVVRDRLVRGVCNAGSVPGQPVASGAAATDSDARFADRLADDLRANAANKAQCEELIGSVREINGRAK